MPTDESRRIVVDIFVKRRIATSLNRSMNRVWPSVAARATAAPGARRWTGMFSTRPAASLLGQPIATCARSGRRAAQSAAAPADRADGYPAPSRLVRRQYPASRDLRGNAPFHRCLPDASLAPFRHDRLIAHNNTLKRRQHHRESSGRSRSPGANRASDIVAIVTGAARGMGRAMTLALPSPRTGCRADLDRADAMREVLDAAQRMARASASSGRLRHLHGRLPERGRHRDRPLGAVHVCHNPSSRCRRRTVERRARAAAFSSTREAGAA